KPGSAGLFNSSVAMEPPERAIFEIGRLSRLLLPRMPRPWSLPWGLVVFFAPTSFAFAQAAHTPSAWFEGKRPEAVPDLSSDLVDPPGLSRFPLVSRAGFSNGSKVFSSSSIWSFEGRAHIRVIEGLALSAVLPFGLRSFSDEPHKFFLGNVTAGIGGGGKI